MSSESFQDTKINCISIHQQWTTQYEIKKTIYKGIKKVQHLGINFTKKVQNMYTENYKTVERIMKLEPIIQSEVSQKEKHQYSILTHIYGI